MPHAHKPRHSLHHPRPARRPAVPASRALAFIDAERLDKALSALVPDEGDRAFIVRCLISEGPIHHRGANFVLISLLAQALGDIKTRVTKSGMPVSMRLPPHLEDTVEDGNYPIDLPTRALRELAGGDETLLEVMADCLTDGPPQHALANVVMVSLLEHLLDARRG